MTKIPYSIKLTKCEKCDHITLAPVIKNKPNLYPKYCGKCGNKHSLFYRIRLRLWWYLNHILDKLLRL